MVKAHPYDAEVKVCDGVAVTFCRTGPILGSSSLDLKLDGPTPLRVVFSGDLGRWNKRILRDPEFVPEADVLLVESTYGDRLHPPNPDEAVAKLVNDGVRRGNHHPRVRCGPHPGTAVGAPRVEKPEPYPTWYDSFMPNNYQQHSTRPDELSGRALAFCRHYAEHANAARACREAGYALRNGNSAAVTGSRLLRDVKVRREIRRLRADAAATAQLSMNEVACSLRHEAMAPKLAIFDRKGRVKPPHRWPKGLEHAIAGLQIEHTTRVRLDESGRPVLHKRTGKPLRDVVCTYKVNFVRPIEAKRILAQWLGMIGNKEFEPGVVMPLTTIVLEADEEQTPELDGRCPPTRLSPIGLLSSEM